MTFINGARGRPIAVAALSIFITLTLCGFSGTTAAGNGTANVEPDEGCTANHPARQSLVTDIPEEAAHLQEIVVCAGTNAAGKTTSIISNHSNAVWIFINDGNAQPRFRLLSGKKSEVFRATVTQQQLYQYAYMAPSDTMTLPADMEWHISPILTGTWLAQDVYNAAFKKVVKSAATKLLSAKSKSRAALIQCGFSAYSSLTNRDVTGNSTSDTVLQTFDDVTTAGTCASALGDASHEIGSTKVAKIVAAVEGAGEATETISKIHIGWRWVQSLCLAVKYC